MIPDPPRQLSLAALWQAVRARPRSLLIGAAFTVIPIFQIVFFTLFTRLGPPGLPSLSDIRVRNEGIPARGEIVRVEVVDNLTINGVKPMRVFFRYKVDGKEREASMITDSVAEVSTWQQGRPVEIRYLDDKAILTEVPSIMHGAEIYVLLMPLFSFVLFAVPFLVYAGTGIRRRYRLFKLGVVRPAKLSSFEALASYWTRQWGPSAQFKATYTYADSGGREIFGMAPSADLTLLNEKKKGNEISILVLPTDERRSTILDSPTERVLMPR